MITKTITRFTLMLTLCFSVTAVALTLEGVPQQGGLMRGLASPGAKIWLDEQVLKVGPKGEFVFGFGRDETGSRLLTINYPDGTQEQQSIVIQARDYQIQRIEGIAKRIMKPDPANVARARKDNLLVAKARQVDSARLDFNQEFIWPVIGPISGVYGSQRFYNGEPRRPHYGVDVARPTGTPVVAPADGVITLWVPDMFYSGGTMIIDHGFGVNSTFLHLSGALVAEGAEVKQGQPVALIGATGRVTGAHLDWRMNWHSARLDPQLIVPDMDTLRAEHRSIQATGG